MIVREGQLVVYIPRIIRNLNTYHTLNHGVVGQP